MYAIRGPKRKFHHYFKVEKVDAKERKFLQPQKMYSRVSVNMGADDKMF